MADTGFNLTTTNEANHWLNPDNAEASDDVYANSVSHLNYEWYHGFGIDADLPAICTIDGIEIKVEGHAAVADDSTLGIRLSWDAGDTNTGTTVSRSFNTGADQEQTWGGATETWGRAWSQTEFTLNNFWLRIGQGVLDKNVNVDAISVKVYYTEITTTTSTSSTSTSTTSISTSSTSSSTSSTSSSSSSTSTTSTSSSTSSTSTTSTSVSDTTTSTTSSSTSSTSTSSTSSSTSSTSSSTSSTSTSVSTSTSTSTTTIMYKGVLDLIYDQRPGFGEVSYI